MKKAQYGMMLSSLLFYKHFQQDLESIEFKVNPYDICVVNSMVGGQQQTVTWYVDDVKVSHISKQVNEEFIKWYENKYGNDLNGHIKVTRGKKHEYLAILLDYSNKGNLKIDMKAYIQDVVETLLESLSENVKCPWTSRLFNKCNDNKQLNQQKQEIFHTYVMKCMFLAKRGRRDVLAGVSVLSTRVLTPNQDNWNKLTRLRSYLKSRINIVLLLEADNVQELKWYIDASFGTHSDL